MNDVLTSTLSKVIRVNDLKLSLNRTLKFRAHLRNVSSAHLIEPEFRVSKLMLIFLNLRLEIRDKISRYNASEELVSITSINAREFTANDVILSTVILEDIVNDTQQLNKVRKVKRKDFANSLTLPLTVGMV